MTSHSPSQSTLATDKEGEAQKDEAPGEVTVPWGPDLQSRRSELQLGSLSTTHVALGRLFAAGKEAALVRGPSEFWIPDMSPT